NNVSVVPVKDGEANLVPLPQQADPNAVLAIHLKLAEKAKDARRVTVSTPKVGAPVLLGEWSLVPDTAQRLVYRDGSRTPVGGIVDVSGFAGLGRMFSGSEASRATIMLVLAVGLLALAVFVWRSATGVSVYKYSFRFWSALAVGCVAFLLAAIAG